MHGNKSCSRHTIQEDFLKEAVMEFLKALSEAYSDEISSIHLNTTTDFYKDDDVLYKKLMQEQQQSKRYLKMLLVQKLNEMKKDNYIQYQEIINDSYSELEDNLRGRLLYLEKKVKEMEGKSMQRNEAVQESPSKILSRILGNTQIKKKHMEVLIDKILIDSQGSPTIYMKADFKALCYHNREDVNLVLDL
jgi:hypothetical protein